jgi:3-methylfumaryl-CoA hydratase
MAGGLEDAVRGWHPGPRTDTDPLDTSPSAALLAVLDRQEGPPRPGDPLPLLWHWVHFPDWPRHSELGADGHPAHGHFLPPVPNRRRMYAGGRIAVKRALRVGTPATRTSSLAAARVKHGRSGEMLFVTVRHEIHQAGSLALVDEHDLVYRSGDPSRSTADGAAAPVPAAVWHERFTADPVRLFRFSALTANAHRIHYDHPYATGVENYPGLVVHGPLLAVLMGELIRRAAPDREIRSFGYRFHRPVFAGETMTVAGDPVGECDARAEVATERGGRHATAEVTFA